MKYVPNGPHSRPSEPGWYWAKCAALLSDHEYECIVRVYTACKDRDTPEAHSSRAPDTVFWDGENVSIEDERLLAFAGPIQTPER
jgi:hypothetical protein